MNSFSFGDFITALGLAFAIEGLFFLAFPEPVRRMMVSVANSPNAQLRLAGFISAIIGIIIIWVVRGM
ncbi:DUF2065 domain-containing protein [Labrys sp. KB_33_2]|uniref:DUF2065 domain-containing protein n=1 Tax=unclassified Labrys (in: a-proteobacteria) TaxID=2688601 RepID=UPI003EBCCB3E